MNQNELLDYFLAKKESEQQKFNEAKTQAIKEKYESSMYYHQYELMMKTLGKIEAYNDAIEAING